MSNNHILNSWKEISSYLGRGIRTVQRWEASFGMPVHRPAGKDRSAVVAFSAELDAWLQAERTRIFAKPATVEAHSSQPQRIQKLEHMHSLADSLVRRTEDLRDNCSKLHNHLRRSEELWLALSSLRRLRRGESKLDPCQKIVA